MFNAPGTEIADPMQFAIDERLSRLTEDQVSAKHDLSGGLRGNNRLLALT
jgi:hypothetical protein